MKQAIQIILHISLFINGLCQEPLRQGLSEVEKSLVLKKEFKDGLWLEYENWNSPDEQPIPLKLVGKGLYDARDNKNGPWNYYTVDSTKLEYYTIDSNKLVYQKFFTNGLIDSSKIYYLHTNSVYIFHDYINGSEIWYYPEGEMMDSIIWIPLRGNKWRRLWFDSNKKLHSKEERNARWQLDGYWLAYGYNPDNNHYLMNKTHYKNGKRDGLDYIYYSKSGMVWRLSYFRDDKEKMRQTFYEDGRLRSKVPYKNGNIDGKAYYYDADGKLEKITIFKDGKPVETIEY